uniref:Galectin n=1 Tax=Astyanax mexicanus TaxID=7994 RepID=A0A3B1J9G2_ASTMX
DGDDVALHFNPRIGQKVTLNTAVIIHFSFFLRFAINFKTGSSDGDDVALHFNPLIGQKVTLSSFRNGKWESEESASAEPFTKGAPFTMFFVFVNGVKHCMFKHRIPVEKVSTLNIDGDVFINMLGYINVS